MEALTAEIIQQSTSSLSEESTSSSVNKSEVASFFINAFGNNTETTADYLFDILNIVDPLFLLKKRSIDNVIGNNSTDVSSIKVMKQEQGEVAPAQVALDFDVLKDTYVNDEVDEIQVTFAMQIQNDQGMAANIIGKGGVNIKDILTTTGVKTNLENIKPNSYQKDRAVFFMGKCKQTLAAYQMSLQKMIAKNNERKDSQPGLPQKDFEKEPLIMVVPNETCPKLIGKGGMNIRTIQSSCGAKTSIEQEESMHAEHSFGRRIYITGTMKQKIHAAYLIMRFLASDCYNDLIPASWKGYIPQALNNSRAPHPPPYGVSYLPHPSAPALAQPQYPHHYATTTTTSQFPPPPQQHGR